MHTISQSLGHLPEFAPSGVLDTARIVLAILAGLILGPMLLVAYRTKNIGFYSLGIFVFLSFVSGFDGVGRPSPFYSLPLRALGLVLAAYWMWKRRDSSTA